LDLLQSRQLHRRHRHDLPGVMMIIMPPVLALDGRHPPRPRRQKMTKMFPSEPSYAWWEFAIPTRTYFNSKLRLPLRLFFFVIVIVIAIVRMNPVTVTVVGYRASIAEYSRFSSRPLAIVTTSGPTCPVRICCYLAAINFLEESR
jgi:hypothetical protein